MSSSDFTQRRRQERQVQAAAHAEEVQMDKRKIGTWIASGPCEKTIELPKLYQGRVPQSRGIWLQLGEWAFWGIRM